MNVNVRCVSVCNDRLRINIAKAADYQRMT